MQSSLQVDHASPRKPTPSQIVAHRWIGAHLKDMHDASSEQDPKLSPREVASKWVKKHSDDILNSIQSNLIPLNESHCLPFETSTASNGLPVCVEAMMFGLFSALSLPIGALLGVYLHPISKGVTARWMALGAGALVFSVATQIYGNSLFALLAISREYGPFDEGCKQQHGMSVCDEKFWNMVVQMVAGLVGAGMYVAMNRWLEQWSAANSSICGSGGDAEDAPDTVDEYAEKEPSENSSCVGTPRTLKHANRNIALAMWLGMLLDSIPEAIMLGLMTNRHQISFGFLFAIFLANFPEAFSGASILIAEDMGTTTTVSLWSSIFVLTGVISLIASFCMPETCSGEMFSSSAVYGTALAQGLTGGSMLAMLSTAMLPEAYKGARHVAGIYFVLGFVLSVLIETLNAYMAGPQELLHSGPHHTVGLAR